MFFFSVSFLRLLVLLRLKKKMYFVLFLMFAAAL